MVTETSQNEHNFKREMLAALPNLRAFAISLIRSRDRADDLVQDTIMKAWAKQESYQPGTNMRAWLVTILRNEFYSQIRKSGREVQDTDGVYTSRLSVPPEQHGSVDLQDFKTALAKLPEDQREAILLIGASGFAYEEAAEICGCPVGTIKSRVSRARLRLQELLGIQDENEFGPDAQVAAVTSVAAIR
ncbi:RNA polymerase sigma-70 factor (ECF subfamily) [Rhizobium skierniewicense]|uniref:RNA polymerase sigma factor n=1 Tax=Rhizobium skierniewicense TaxID=984260 RepID=A0A7W6CFL0_9HYPH|nr:sigma-70 family RNA polymerase sigma factor [Rhizobium skierniewicense]MBB3948524.1 RNA polymerase sigma-70 factor (ECF subfamily) [Rhizobium skierniewicense]NTF33023.1 sigma-70 family RNA polymerase sigma factor [Rhizobium skierniewicense]